MAFWKESMINRLSNLINLYRSAAKESQVLCSNGDGGINNNDEDSQDLEDGQVTFLLPSPRPHHCQNLYVEDDQVNFLCPSPRPHHCQDLYVEDDQVTFLCPFPHQCQQQAAQEIEDSASRLFAH